MINPNPQVFEAQQIQRNASNSESVDIHNEFDEDAIDEFDALEVFDLCRHIMDPEHPLTLEQLNVMQHNGIEVDNDNNLVRIHFTPTITHCSMATLIGLCIRVKLLRAMPKRFKVDIMVSPGSHQSEEAVNKQLNDKERIAAALENAKLLGVVNKCIAG